MKKIILYGCLLLVIVLAVVALSNRITLVETAAKPAQTPAQLRIPALQINAPVLPVGQTASGAMDAPTSKALHSPYWTSVFWYDQGPVPGQEGNAVIAGHVDRVGGDPAIFWSLSSLVAGDKVFVTMKSGQQLQFVVNRVVRYPASAPGQDVINAVFGPSSGHHLNLITCSGVWTGNGYDERLVVFTTLV
ncbi:MAG TPA: class F sortase [Ktedonobacteraceae bacterium]|nr:class F sortase [Ktedonobacteraceae bacterium]